MIRLLVLSAVCGLVSVSQFTFAGESASKGEQSRMPAAQAGRKLDPERLKQFRERLGNRLPVPENLEKRTWQIGDTSREALVYIPKSTGQKRPLIFVFHGHGGRGEHPARKLAIHDLWPDALCIYPQGLPTPVPLLDPEGKLPGWQTAMGNQQDRDLLFFDEMLKTMVKDHEADENRIYSTGHSNGGYFTYVLCAARGDKLAAVAPIASMHDVKDFRLQKPKPVLHIAGKEDPIVKFRGQEWTMEQIRKLNGCDPMGQPAGELCTEYGSANGYPVVTYVHTGGHEIPSDAGQKIVDFFRKYPKR